jgi:hypothetical protein
MTVLVLSFYKQMKFGLQFILCLKFWCRVTHMLRRRVMGSVLERSSIYALVIVVVLVGSFLFYFCFSL